VDVGTLPNNVKYCVPWLYGDCLLVVDLLRFRFQCQVFDLVFLCCLINDGSSTASSRATYAAHEALALILIIPTYSTTQRQQSGGVLHAPVTNRSILVHLGSSGAHLGSSHVVEWGRIIL